MINVFRWLDEINIHLRPEDISVVLVGNKKDLIDQREVSTEEATDFAVQKEIFFLETSAKDNSDGMVENVFGSLIGEVIKRKENKFKEEDIIMRENLKVELKRDVHEKKPEKKKSGCCDK